MDPVIKSLTLKGFRSVRAERIELDNPTFLVGMNGSGKSNIVDALAFLAEAMTTSLQAVVARRGGLASLCHRAPSSSKPQGFGIGVEFGRINGDIAGGQYAFEVRALSEHVFEVCQERCHVTATDGRTAYFERSEEREGSSLATSERHVLPLLDRDSLGLPLVGGQTRFSPIVRTLAALRTYSIDPMKLRELQDPDSGAVLHRDGSNAASVLREIERSTEGGLARIGELLSVVVPHKVDVHPAQHGNKIALEFTQTWGEDKHLQFDAFSMSDGTLRTLGLLAAIFQPRTPSLIVLEEPEATLHPRAALSLVLELLELASDRMQVVVTTHSPDVLDAKWIEDRHLRMVIWQEGVTRVSSIGTGAREALEEQLAGAGELLKSNVLEPESLPEADTEIELFQTVA